MLKNNCPFLSFSYVSISISFCGLLPVFQGNTCKDVKYFLFTSFFLCSDTQKLRGKTSSVLHGKTSSQPFGVGQRKEGRMLLSQHPTNSPFPFLIPTSLLYFYPPYFFLLFLPLFISQYFSVFLFPFTIILFQIFLAIEKKSSSVFFEVIKPIATNISKIELVHNQYGSLSF